MNPCEREPECAWAEEALFELRDGSLDASARERLHVHLETCADCRAQQAFDGRLAKLMATAPIASPTPLVGKVRERVRHQRLAGATAFAALAASLCLAVGWLVWTVRTNDTGGPGAGAAPPPSTNGDRGADSIGVEQPAPSANGESAAHPAPPATGRSKQHNKRLLTACLRGKA